MLSTSQPSTAKAQSDLLQALRWLDHVSRQGGTQSEIAAAKDAVSAAMSAAGLSSATANGPNAGAQGQSSAVSGISTGTVNGAPSTSLEIGQPSIEFAPGSYASLSLGEPSISIEPGTSVASALAAPAPGFTGNSSTLSNGMSVQGVTTSTTPGISLGNPGTRDQSQGRVDAFAAPGLAGALSSKDQAAIDAMGRQGINQDQSLAGIDPFGMAAALDAPGTLANPSGLRQADLDLDLSGIQPAIDSRDQARDQSIGSIDAFGGPSSTGKGIATISGLEPGLQAAMNDALARAAVSEDIAEGQVAKGIATNNQGLVEQGNMALSGLASSAFGSALDPNNPSPSSVLGLANSRDQSIEGRSNLSASNPDAYATAPDMGISVTGGVMSPGDIAASDAAEDDLSIGSAIDQDAASLGVTSSNPDANADAGQREALGRPATQSVISPNSVADVLGLDLSTAEGREAAAAIAGANSGQSDAKGSGISSSSDPTGPAASAGRSGLGMTSDAFGNTKGQGELDNGLDISGALSSEPGVGDAFGDGPGMATGTDNTASSAAPGSFGTGDIGDAFGSNIDQGMGLDAMGFGGAVAGLDAFGNGLDVAGLDIGMGFGGFGADAFGGDGASGFG